MDSAAVLKKYSQFKVSCYQAASRWVKPGKILFFGDSITELYPLKKAFSGYPTVNSGISGNTTRDLLERMDICVYPYHPGAVVLLVGVNDIINEKKDAQWVVDNYRKILQELHAHGIRKIIVQSCYPTCGDHAYANEELRRVNVHLRRLAQEFGCIYADIHPALLDPNTGELVPSFTRDGLHLNKTGYLAVTQILKPAIEQISELSRAVNN